MPILQEYHRFTMHTPEGQDIDLTPYVDKVQIQLTNIREVMEARINAITECVQAFGHAVATSRHVLDVWIAQYQSVSVGKPSKKALGRRYYLRRMARGKGLRWDNLKAR